MKAINSRMRVALSLGVISMLAFGCVFGPEEDAQEKNSERLHCKPLTEKENVIHNLELSYNTADIECYTELLQADYIWYNQTAEVQGGLNEYYLRDEDIEKTTNLFLAAKGQHPDSDKNLDKLELKLSSGTWTQITEFNEEACDDCWQTTREYSLTLVFNGGELTLYARDNVQLIIVGVDKDAQRIYQLARAFDIRQ
jgi:hypothetical protein